VYKRQFLYVAEHKEQGIIAGLAGGMGSLWLNLGTPVATELAWWVEEEHRKSPVALRLYKAFEKWAHDKGVTTIIMSDLVIEGHAPAEKLFNKMGFSVVERSHIKKG
jgi:GNAT superfamily N-acetyltransferase